MQLKILNYPTPDQIRQNQAFADAHWGGYDDNQEELLLDFFQKPDVILQLVDSTELISSLVVFLRDFIYQNRPAKLIGIGGVVTQTKLRRQGYATYLLRQTLDHFRHLDIALLGTEISVHGHFYETVGFKPLGRPYYFLNRLNVKKAETGAMIAPLSNTQLADLILSGSGELFVGSGNF